MYFSVLIYHVLIHEYRHPLLMYLSLHILIYTYLKLWFDFYFLPCLDLFPIRDSTCTFFGSVETNFSQNYEEGKSNDNFLPPLGESLVSESPFSSSSSFVLGLACVHPGGGQEEKKDK